MVSKKAASDPSTDPVTEDTLAKTLEKLVASNRLAFEFGDTYPSATLQAGPSLPPVKSGTTAPSQLQYTVTQAIQSVLGRSFKQGDHRSFRAALEVSFEQKEVAGRTAYEWRPRAYPAVGATDIGGGVSGAQFSLVSFATGLHELAAPLIENLHPLDPNVDEEEFGATRAIFETAWDEFVGELSREGGPRASRADTLARSIFVEGGGLLVNLGTLLGAIQRPVVAQTGALTGVFKFDRTRVVTSEEEGHLTSFIALTDYYFAVVRAWENYRNTFVDNTDLGTGLLLIERSLAVIEDGVNEVYLAMDSVDVDQSERLVILIGFKGADGGLTIEDFLSWISSFASTEAPELIREGGILGVSAIIPTADKLASLLTNTNVNTPGFIELIKAPPGGSLLPSQFNHARVLNPLDELRRYLQALAKQARAIIPPQNNP